MNKQTQEALKMAIGKLVLEKMTSGNDVPVSRCTITNVEIHALSKEALEQPAQEPDDLMQGRWIRFNEDDDTTQLLIELEIAMNGIKGSAKSPAVIDVLRQAVDYFKKPLTRDWKETIDERIARDSVFKAALEQPWQGLTDDEIKTLDLDNDVISVIFQVEQALKDKNHG